MNMMEKEKISKSVKKSKSSKSEKTKKKPSKEKKEKRRSGPRPKLHEVDVLMPSRDEPADKPSKKSKLLDIDPKATIRNLKTEL